MPGPGHFSQPGIFPGRLHPPWSFRLDQRLQVVRASSLTFFAHPDKCHSPGPSQPLPPGAGSGHRRVTGGDGGWVRPKGCHARCREPLTAARHQNTGSPTQDNERLRRAKGCGATEAAPGTSCLGRRTRKRTGRRGGIQLGDGGWYATSVLSQAGAKVAVSSEELGWG